jgi:hypothetical protein
MVNRRASRHRARLVTGIVTLELVVAMGILASVMLPVAYSVVREQRLARAYYYRAVAMEIVDGEMEVLLAGEWQTYSRGQHEYRVRAEAAKNLPPGRFLLSLNESQVRLEWRPRKPGQGGAVTRVASIPARLETKTKAP